MGLVKNELHRFKYVYDFDEDGGAVSNISLRPDGNSIPSGFVIRSVSVYVATAITSGGTPTITFGNSDNRDGYLEDVVSAMGLTAGSSIREGEVAGALLWDDTNDHALEYVVPSEAVGVPSMTVGANALTAGALVLYIDGYLPGAAS